MDGSTKRFVIPVYQRNYDWRQENCKQLFDDLVKTIKTNRDTHFFGSIVSVYSPSGSTMEFLIVDGQQRLTTISILLLAVYNLLRENAISSNDSMLAQRIYEEYLVDRFQPTEKRMKLKPVKHDREAFSRLFDSAKEFVSDSHLTHNYQYFAARILQKKELSADQIVDAIGRLQIINIELTQGDDPQLIFESINSTGVDLTEGDKIRNYMLMNLSPAEQEMFYHQYWEPIEQQVKRDGETDDVGLFVRDFLTAEQSEIPNLNRIYTDFKEFAQSFESREDLFKRLLRASRSYRKLLAPGTIPDSESAYLMANINRQECLPSYPFLLQVFQMNDTEVISSEQTREILRIVDSYVLRRLICDLPTNSLNKVFAELHKSVCSHDSTVPYEKRVSYVLRSRTGKARMPDDSEFRTGLLERHVYDLRSKNRSYFFSRLENGTSKSAVIHGIDDVVYEKMRSGEYTVEHVMPQSLTPEWRRELGEDFQQIHETWLHRLGNLTLTAYNSEMGNKTFANKAGRTLSDLKADNFGFASEAKHLYLNAFIADQSHWNESAIKTRAEALADRALSIWTYPPSDYSPPKKEEFAYSIKQHKPGFFTNSKPSAFRMDGVEYKVSTWHEITEQAIRILGKKSPDCLKEAARNSSTIRFSDEKTTSLPMEEVVSDVFVCFSGSTWEKCNILKKALSTFQEIDIEIVVTAEIEDDEDTV